MVNGKTKIKTTTSIFKLKHDVLRIVANFFLGADVVAVLFNRIIVAEASILLIRGMEEQAMLNEIQKIDLFNILFCCGVFLSYAILLIVNYFLYRSDKTIIKYVMIGIYVTLAIGNILRFCTI